MMTSNPIIGLDGYPQEIDDKLLYFNEYIKDMDIHPEQGVIFLCKGELHFVIKKLGSLYKTVTFSENDPIEHIVSVREIIGSISKISFC